MKFYELTYLVRPEKKEVQSFCEKVNSLIQEQGGILEKIKRPEKLNLSYPIQSQNQFFENAFLASLDFYLDQTKLRELEKKLKKQDVLRFVILAKKPKKISSAMAKKTLTKEKKPPLTTSEVVRRRPKKVELKEIEKKLEEILKE